VTELRLALGALIARWETHRDELLRFGDAASKRGARHVFARALACHLTDRIDEVKAIVSPADARQPPLPFGALGGLTVPIPPAECALRDECAARIDVRPLTADERSQVEPADENERLEARERAAPVLYPQACSIIGCGHLEVIRGE
jgi:hypothetical protein